MSSELRAGDEFAGHRIEAVAGAGGMGVVYRATHLLLGRTVALKLMAPALASNAAFRSRFEREWRMLGGLDHPNIIDIYEAGEVDDRPYISMRWVAGGDLAARLRGTTGLEPGVALDILGQVAAALDAAHARGVVHRDIKPANVLLDGERVWLTDFGAGKDLEGLDTRTATGQWVGTVHYVAPELLDGVTATPRSDVYSLGCVLFEALTGHVPFERENDVATLWAHRFQPPPRTSELRASLPSALDDVLRRALAKEPSERPASAGELIRAARAAAAPRPSGAPTRVGDAAPAPPRRRALAAVAGALVMLGIGLAAGLALGGSSDEAPQPTAASRQAAKAPLVERIELPEEVSPGQLAAANGLVFVADERNPQIIVVDPDTRKVLDPIKTRDSVQDLDLNFTGDHLWATLRDGWLLDIDLETEKKTYVRADIDVRRIAIGTDDVIAISTREDGRRLQKIDAQRHRPAGKPVENGRATTALEGHGEGAIQLWALPTSLTFWDKDLEEPYDVEIPVDGTAVDVLNTGAFAWVPTVDTNLLLSFDTTTGKQAAKIPMPPKPAGLDWEGELLWVASQTGFVQRVHPKTGRKVGDPIDTGPLLGPIDVSLGVAWATGPSYLVRIENRDRLTEG